MPKEIIVVDNAPTDSSTKEVVGLFPEVIYHLEPRAGLDIARNAGIKRATASIVAFMDDDIKAGPYSIYEIAKTFEQTCHAAMTGLVIASELESEAQLLFEQEWSFNRGYIDRVYDRAFFERHLSAGPPVWDIGAGANMAFRKAALEETGYFDERLDVGAAGCNGDSEIWFRILAKGYTIAYNPRSVVYHQHRKDLKGLQRQLFNYMKGFTVAALIQQQLVKEAGYKRQLFRVLPRWYFHLMAKGFPKYEGRYQTVFSEMKGIISGLFYYRKHKNNKVITK